MVYLYINEKNGQIKKKKKKEKKRKKKKRKGSAGSRTANLLIKS